MSADVTTPSPANGDQLHEAQSQRKLLWILIGIVAVGVALLVGRLPRHKRDREVNARAERQQNALQIVEVQTVHSASSTRDLTLPGTVTALRIAHIYARASGYLNARYVDLGDAVHQGQLLGIISAPDLDATVVQQSATVPQTRDNAQTAQSNLQLQQATYSRVHTLVLHGILSQQDDDTARVAVESAQSNLNAMQNAVKSAQGALAHEQSLARFEQIRSPIDGTITARNVEVGNLVSATGAAQGLLVTAAASTGGAQGGELFDVVDLRSLEVFVSVPEQDAPFVQTGQPVDLTFSEIPGQTFPGTVIRSSDSLSQQTRTLLAEIKHYVAPNPGILISGDSLLSLARGQFVPVVENNVIQMRPVRVGRDLGTEVYVTSGLHEGDLVVVSPNDAVQQGLRVSPRAAPAGQLGADESPRAGAEDSKKSGKQK